MYWTAVHDAIEKASGITWDECHKIYILMDEKQVEVTEGYGYTVLPVTSVSQALGTVKGWYEEACGLRFVQSVTTASDGSDGFESLIPQQ